MPLYDHRCLDCNLVFERYLSVSEVNEYDKGTFKVLCDCGSHKTIRVLSEFFPRAFQPQHLRDLCHDAPYVRNTAEMKDAIKRFNDSDLGRKQGAVRINDSLRGREV